MNNENMNEELLNEFSKRISDFLELKMNEYKKISDNLISTKKEKISRLKIENKELNLDDFLYDSIIELTGFLNNLERDNDDLRYLINYDYTKKTGRQTPD